MKNKILTTGILLMSVILSSCGAAGTDSGTSTVSGTAVSSGTVAAIEEDWETAYSSYLNEMYKNSKVPDGLYYFCKNIDGAGTPELIVCTFGGPTVYAFNDGAVEEIGIYAGEGGSNRLFYSEDPAYPGIFTFWIGGGSDHYEYMTVQDGKLSTIKLWKKHYSDRKERDSIEEFSSDKQMIRESKRVYKNDQDIDMYKMTPRNDVSEDMKNRRNMFKSISIQHSEKKSLKTKEIKEIGVGQENEYTQINNNRVNGGFLIPYNGGYFHDLEINKEDGSSEVVVIYQDGKGNNTEQKDFSDACSMYADQDYIYFYDEKNNELRRIKDGKHETVIDFQYTRYQQRNPLFFAEDAIYYGDVANFNKTYIYKVNYDGTDKQELFQTDVALEQICIYKNELWFKYYDTDGAGKINLLNDEVTVYKGIPPEGESDAGRQLSINNGYVYFNSEDGFYRLNIQEDCIEQVFKKQADAVNFVEDSLLFCHNRVLYRMDLAGLKAIKTREENTGRFNGIRVEDGKIYISTDTGAISQIDKEGKTVKDIIR